MVTECGLCCNRYCDSAGTDRFVAVCSGYTREPQPMTNADRIRAMSDEELAKWMAGLTTVGACNDLGIPDSDLCDRKCESCCLAWLRRAAEEEL